MFKVNSSDVKKSMVWISHTSITENLRYLGRDSIEAV